MALSDDITTQLGATWLLGITNFDAPSTGTVNSSRLALCILQARGLVLQYAGLSEPDDHTGVDYGTFLGLMVLATRCELERARNMFAQEVQTLEAELAKRGATHRDRVKFAITTNSPVDTTNEDQDSRKARMAPSHFSDRRIL